VAERLALRPAGLAGKRVRRRPRGHPACPTQRRAANIKVDVVGGAAVVEAKAFPAETQRRGESAEPGPRITTLGGIGEETQGSERAEEGSPSLRSDGRLAIGRRLTTCPTRGGPWWTGQEACPTALRGRVSGEDTETGLERIGGHSPWGRRSAEEAGNAEEDLGANRRGARRNADTLLHCDKPQTKGGRGGRAVLVEAEAFTAETQRCRESAENATTRLGRLWGLARFGLVDCRGSRARRGTPAGKSSRRATIRTDSSTTRGGRDDAR